MQITANIVDVIQGVCFYGTCVVRDGHIAEVSRIGEERDGESYLMPGFIDAHVHIESSMLVPTEFARLAVRHGTVATVSDPHEIANVLGVDGVLYMADNARNTPLKIHFGVPSCVPATDFETAGAVIDADAVEALLQREDMVYLAEMMNYPGVLHEVPEVIRKIEAAKRIGKRIDGHAPGLMGDDVIKYIAAGISTDHECFTLEEALHKRANGMRIIIREGSAAKNFEALHSLIGEFPDEVMFCSDDKHPDDLIVSHINGIARRAMQKGYRWQDVLKAACLNPVLHYNLHVGLLREGDPADMILVGDLRAFEVESTYIGGACVYEGGKVLLDPPRPDVVNHFRAEMITPEDLAVSSESGSTVRVIQALDGELITQETEAHLSQEHGWLKPDVPADILKLVVVNRYEPATPAVAFIKGFGQKGGAIASSVAHDSHNILAVGVSDAELVKAINALIREGGGVIAVQDEVEKSLALPIAGLMSPESGEVVASAYTAIDKFVKETLGSTLTAPFMTLSFMALLVIPELKLSDKGLFDCRSFSFTPVVKEG